MKKTHKTVTITTIIMLILAVVIVWVFYIMTQKPQTTKETAPTTEAGKLINKNMEDNYPGTPREVLKLYCRITQCIYNDEISETEFEQLAEQIRFLFDDELLENNPLKTFKDNLYADVESYHKNNQRISSCDIQLASETDYAAIEKDEYATLKLSLLVQQKGKKKNIERTNEQFLLRKDDKERWKIVHWKLMNDNVVE